MTWSFGEKKTCASFSASLSGDHFSDAHFGRCGQPVCFTETSLPAPANAPHRAAQHSAPYGRPDRSAEVPGPEQRGGPPPRSAAGSAPVRQAGPCAKPKCPQTRRAHHPEPRMAMPSSRQPLRAHPRCCQRAAQSHAKLQPNGRSQRVLRHALEDNCAYPAAGEH